MWPPIVQAFVPKKIEGDVQLRPLVSDDQHIIWEMLMHAAHETTLESVQSLPILARYAEEFGRQGDLGVVAVDRYQDPVGAAWVRLFSEGGLAHQVAEDIPELAIAVLPDYRGKGIGSKLLQSLLLAAREAPFRGISLSCRDGNPAMGLYKRSGFVKVPGSEVKNRVGGISVTLDLLFDRITARKATPDDVSLVLDFIKRKSEFDRAVGAFTGELKVTRDRLLETVFSESPYAHVLLAERISSAPIGFAFYVFRYSSFAGRPSLWLDDLYVDESKRSQGAGAALRNELASIAKQHDCTHLGWTADARNVRGMKFYARIGAEVSERHGNRGVLKWIPSDWNVR